MGTRSLTCFIHENGEEFVTMYRQFDGYPAGHGAELAEFLSGMRMVNGIPLDKMGHERMANGMGCLAAQVIANFKTEVGGVYLYWPNARGVGEEWVYVITGVEGGEPHLKVYCAYDACRIARFDGPASAYAAWLKITTENEDA